MGDGQRDIHGDAATRGAPGLARKLEAARALAERRRHRIQWAAAILGIAAYLGERINWPGGWRLFRTDLELEFFALCIGVALGVNIIRDGASVRRVIVDFLRHILVGADRRGDGDGR